MYFFASKIYLRLLQLPDNTSGLSPEGPTSFFKQKENDDRLKKKNILTELCISI